MNMLKKGSFEEKIYHFCDGKMTVTEIAKKSGKDIQYVGSVISRLKRKGLIKIINFQGKNMPKKFL